MPVAVVVEFAGTTLDQYDQLNEIMGYAPGGAAPPGCLFHWVMATEGECA